MEEIRHHKPQAHKPKVRAESRVTMESEWSHNGVSMAGARIVSSNYVVLGAQWLQIDWSLQ